VEVFDLDLFEASTATRSDDDPGADDELPTLGAGDEGPEVRALQEMLNRVRAAGLVPDGVYGPATTAAIERFQSDVWLAITGRADHTTRMLLAALDANPTAPAPIPSAPTQPTPAWPVPTVGDGSFPGCQVSVVGDSLMAGMASVHRDALAEIGCAADVDGVGGRSLNVGWQCRVPTGTGTSLRLLSEPQPGNDTCAPSGLELLELWAAAGGLGDLVVIALGTNDAGLHRESTWVSHWESAMRIAGDRPVLFLTSQARAGDRRIDAQAAYSAALRTWCAATPRCHVADWAATAIANDPASYSDGVHLRSGATRARAGFIRDSVAAVLSTLDPATIASTIPPTTIPTVPTTTIPTAPTTTIPTVPTTTIPTIPTTTIPTTTIPTTTIPTTTIPTTTIPTTTIPTTTIPPTTIPTTTIPPTTTSPTSTSTSTSSTTTVP
jgi:peptidoglycan hydrolase-like protein with peptidoglycan-binding domain